MIGFPIARSASLSQLVTADDRPTRSQLPEALPCPKFPSAVAVVRAVTSEFVLGYRHRHKGSEPRDG
jgi:hypothetical protein